MKDSKHTAKSRLDESNGKKRLRRTMDKMRNAKSRINESEELKNRRHSKNSRRMVKLRLKETGEQILVHEKSEKKFS